MGKKISKEALDKELNKFKMICEYSFYTGKNDLKINDKKQEIAEVDDDLEPVEADGDAEGKDTEAALNNVSKDLGVDADNDPQAGQDMGGDLDQSQEPQPEVAPETQEPASDEVEIDVTSIVKGSEEAKDAATSASNNTMHLLKKFKDLEHRVASMDRISHKIDDLEKEIVKRNPTPTEKLEMQSLHAYPFNVKLSDYWSDKEGIYDVMGNEKKPEYILDKDTIKSDYNESNIKNSFDYTEEDI